MGAVVIYLYITPHDFAIVHPQEPLPTTTPTANHAEGKCKAQITWMMRSSGFVVRASIWL
jgi:hypothetical protein